MIVYYYPACGTCKKALAYMKAHNIEGELRHIVETPPKVEELKEVMVRGNIPINKMFNTSGKKYRELNMKEKIPKMSEEALLELLASDGMLIKRPVVLSDKACMVGFKEEAWEKLL